MFPPISRILPILIACGLTGRAQQPGVVPEWDIRKTLEAISSHANRLIPVLDQIDAKSWVQKGAPDTYLAQLNGSRAQARALAKSAADLSRAPEKLSSQLEAFFRLHALETSIGSLAQGIRKYQNPALADLLAGIVAENGANRDKLQQYIVDLAAEKEQHCQVADREAQRCRGILSRQPYPPEKK